MPADAAGDADARRQLALFEYQLRQVERERQVLQEELDAAEGRATAAEARATDLERAAEEDRRRREEAEAGLGEARSKAAAAEAQAQSLARQQRETTELAAATQQELERAQARLAAADADREQLRGRVSESNRVAAETSRPPPESSESLGALWQSNEALRKELAMVKADLAHSQTSHESALATVTMEAEALRRANEELRARLLDAGPRSPAAGASGAGAGGGSSEVLSQELEASRSAQAQWRTNYERVSAQLEQAEGRARTLFAQRDEAEDRCRALQIKYDNLGVEFAAIQKTAQDLQRKSYEQLVAQREAEAEAKRETEQREREAEKEHKDKTRDHMDEAPRRRVIEEPRAPRPMTSTPAPLSTGRARRQMAPPMAGLGVDTPGEVPRLSASAVSAPAGPAESFFNSTPRAELLAHLLASPAPPRSGHSEQARIEQLEESIRRLEAQQRQGPPPQAAAASATAPPPAAASTSPIHVHVHGGGLREVSPLQAPHSAPSARAYGHGDYEERLQELRRVNQAVKGELEQVRARLKTHF